MDDAGGEELELVLSQFSTSLSSYLPLPFRILVLMTTGVLCWALNLHILHLLGIDTSAILDIRSTVPSSATGPIPNGDQQTPQHPHIHPSKLYPPVYQLAGLAALWTILCWFFGFRWLAESQGDTTTGRMVAGFSWAVALALMAMPFDKLKRSERLMFWRSLKRTATDSILRPVPFCDVILADILTSFAKVLGDFWVCVCMFFNLDEASGGYKELGVPFMIALPYIFRFRQCISEYINTPRESPTTYHHHLYHHHHHHAHQPSIFLAPTSASSTPASPKRRSLFNALKYATAFPVIIFSAMQGTHGDPHHHARRALDPKAGAAAAAAAIAEGTSQVAAATTSVGSYMSPSVLFRIWVLSVMINSLYSFWWDVTNDFGLHLLLVPFRKHSIPPPSSSSSGANSTLLRRTLLLPDPLIYYLIIGVDFVLRFTWSLKLSSHLHSVHEIEMGIFMLEALEVLRRWLWVYVRIEWEAVRKGGDSLEERLQRSGASSPSIDLPLLGSTPYNGQYQPGSSMEVSSAAGGGSGNGVVGAGVGAINLDRRSSASHRKTTSKFIDEFKPTSGGGAGAGGGSGLELSPVRPGIREKDFIKGGSPR